MTQKLSSPFLVKSKSFIDVTPTLRRITFSSPQLKSFPHNCASSAIKIFLPQSGQKEPVLPVINDKGICWSENALRPIVRTYTVRNIRPEQGEIDIEFLLPNESHSGPACEFALSITPDKMIGISYPKPLAVPTDVNNYYLIGDSSALPAISAILEYLPQNSQAQVFIHIHQDDELIDFSSPAMIDIRYFFDEDKLIESIRTLSFNDKLAYFWIAGEERIVISLRRYLRHEKQLPFNQLYAIPYWRKGINEEQYHLARHQLMDE